MAIDPVCGMQVDPDHATWTAEHGGETFYFCGKGCMLDFRDEPERFLSAAHRPSMPGHQPMMPERRGAGAHDPHGSHGGHH